MLLRRLLPLLALLPLTGGCGPQSVAAPEPTRLRIETGEGGAVRVRLTGAGASILRERLARGAGPSEIEPVYRLEVAGKETTPPVLARVTPEEGAVVLTPQVSLTPGTRYRARFLGSQLRAGLPNLVEEYTTASTAAASESRVTEIFPHRPTLPANVFRFYLTFSQPMGEGKVFDYVRILDEQGREVPQGFHEVELWAEDHHRLTLWISPGRTKQALGISEQMGAVLKPGRRYTLEVRAGLPDRWGRPLKAPFRCTFRTTAPDHEQPEIADWEISAPKAGSREPLEVRFDEPLDRPLADRVIAVAAGDGREVAGQAVTSRDGSAWRFTPDRPWPAGPLTLTADGELDDLAGNSLHRRFETPAGAGQGPAVEVPIFRRTVHPR